MYVPAHFSMTPQQISQMLHDISYGDLITVGGRGLDATKLPFSLHPGGKFGVLRAHLNRANTQWRDEGAAMIILHGPQAYISPTWSPSSAHGNNVVPTYDYLTLHLHGQLTAHDDYDFLIEHLDVLARQLSPEWHAELDPTWVRRMLRAAVGVEFTIERIEAKAKMSQNAKSGDIEGIIEGLTDVGAEVALIDFMSDVSLPHAKAREAELDRIKENSAKSPTEYEQSGGCPFKHQLAEDFGPF